jgi:hypothetical protein
LLAIVAAVAASWYVRQRSGRAGKQRGLDEPRSSGRDHAEDHRISPAVPAIRPSVVSAADTQSGAGKAAGLIQDAVTSAAGVRYERAADEIVQITADLARARREAERTAEQMATRAAEALAAIRTVGAANAGAVPGDGTDRCPPRYLVKATIAAMRFHAPEQPTYNLTVPDICLESVAAAEAAGFRGSEEELTTATRAGTLDEVGGGRAGAGGEWDRQQVAAFGGRR